MLRSVKDLRGYNIQATDGEIGKVHEFYFDDETWTIRYLVVDTGHWLPGRKVLLSTAVLGQPDWESHQFPVGLTKDYVENSPDIDTNKPVSRQHEMKLHKYYGWYPYWTGGLEPIVPPRAAVEAAQEAQKKVEEEVEKGDPHLRSTRAVIGYHIEATDDEVGHVEDFIVDDETWKIRYIVVDTRNWLPGKHVLVAPQWIEFIDWAASKVHVTLTQEKIKGSPKFDPSVPVNREYEKVLYDYYGRPKYWE